jgi:hypothetical protein
MYYFLEDEYKVDKKNINCIAKAKERWEAQCEAVKDAQYLEKLIFDDLISTIRSYRLRYDFLDDIINKAIAQQKEQKKRDRKDFHTIESMIIDDFFNNDKRFKLIDIITGGWEGCYHVFNFSFKAEKEPVFYSIQIPVKSKLNAKNIEWSAFGKLQFSIKESEHCHRVEYQSYDIASMSKYINDYFGFKEAGSVE